MELALGGTAAVGACFFTNPLEVVKIRMQLQGELQARGQYAVHYRNVFQATVTILKNEGAFAIQKGLIPALWYQWVMNGVRLGTYDWMDKRGHARDSVTGKVNPLKSAIVGSTAGCLGAAIGSPFFLVKTHLQSKSNVQAIAVGHQHGHHGLTSAFVSIYKQFGFFGLYRGLTSSLPRVTVASAAQLSSYEKSVELVRSSGIVKSENRILSALVASLISGLFVSFAMAPFDLVSTRFYNQGMDSNGKGVLYKNVMDCAKKIYRKEGFRGFYKGWSANYFRIGPHTMLSLVFWDQLRHRYHLYQQTQKNGN